jgi:hypothetical protein
MAFSSAFTAFDQLSAADHNKMMFGTANRVDTNVWIGGYLIAADPDFIRREGITRIVKLFADDDGYPGGFVRHPGVRYFVAPADDAPGYDIRDDVVAAVAFIQEGARVGDRILVHCHAGVSRSATVVLMHLMINRGYTLDMAMARLKMVRPFVRPNSGFMCHLRATDARIKRLRVGDEHRRVSSYEAERPWIAPPPLIPADPDVSLALRLARDGAGCAGGPREAALAPPIAPEPTPTPGAGFWSFADRYDDSTPL